MAGSPFAADRLIAWAQTPFGEEVLEGTLGGLMAGVPIAMQGDAHPGAAALTTATAILGGIGMGMAGRRIGASLGARYRDGAPLQDQAGLAATIGRIGGQETMGKALEENGKMLRSQVADYLVNRQAAKMVRDGEVPQAVMDQLMELRQANGFVDAINNAPPAIRQQLDAALAADSATLRQAINNPTLRQQLLQQSGIDLDALVDLEADLVSRANASMPEGLHRLADRFGDTTAVQKMPLVTPELLRAVADSEAAPITGEHVGRAVGRFIGDEVGILGGIGVGMLAANQLGLETPKDRKIRELEAQLAGR
jgi:hypothetical protein